MATLTETKTGSPGRGTRFFAAIGTLAISVGLGGIYWDVAWHVTIGRDSFWIPPHLLVYSGSAFFFLSALGGFLSSAVRRSPARVGFAVALLGTVIQVSAAPLDDLWHELYGLDVTVWSPPHLMGLTGATIGVYGLIQALGTDMSDRPGRRASQPNVVLLFAVALALSMFALGDLDFRSDRRDVFYYPMLAGALAAVPLVGATRFVGRTGTATVVALLYTLFRAAVVPIFAAMGAPDAYVTPPVFVLAPALAIDAALLLTRGRGVLLAALLAGPALLLGEWFIRPVLGLQAWEPLQVVAGFATVTVVATLGGLAGDRLQTLLRSESRREAVEEEVVAARHERDASTARSRG